MMGFIHVVVAVLGLLSVGQSAPVTSCESLIQPLEIQGRDQLLGKWMQVAESTDIRFVELLEKAFLDSYWMKITATNESNAVTIMDTSKMFGFCLSATIKRDVEKNTFHPVNLLKTGCPDCLLFKSQNFMFGRRHTILLLLSKRRNVTAAELDEFRKQAECLNLPSPFFPKPEGDVCPEPPSPEIEIIDEPRFILNGQSMEFTTLTEKITNSFGGPEKFFEKVTEAFSKQD